MDCQHSLKGELEKAIREGRKTLNLEGRRLVRFSADTELLEMEMLNLSYNERTRLPISTGHLRNLTTLNLNHNKLTQFPEDVFMLINLTHLFVNDNQLSTLPASMKNLEKLQELELRNNKLKRVFKYIIDLNNLEKLSVRGNPLPYEEIRSLAVLRALKPQRTVDITGNDN